MSSHRLNGSLRETSKALSKWNKEVFGFAHINIKNREKELEILQIADLDHDKKLEIMEDLKNQRKILETIYQQKSGELWRSEGDRNTIFFSCKHCHNEKKEYN